jgi:hypothetical protein
LEANARAMARPMPRDPPVISAVFPERDTTGTPLPSHPNYSCMRLLFATHILPKRIEGMHGEPAGPNPV